MIKNRESVSMAEALEYIRENKDTETDLVGFIKKFTELKPKDAKDMRVDIEKLNLIKLKSESITNIIDLLPENTEELNKIFTDVSLDEDETNRILQIVKQFK